MKSQSRFWSLVESITNTAISYVIAVIIGHFTYQWFQVPMSLATNMQVTAVFTAASIIRGYLIRRWFNKLGQQKPAKPIEYEPLDLSDADIAKGMLLVRQVLLNDLNGLPLVKIPPVKSSINFPGSGFIVGRTNGWVINDRLTVVEGDMDYHCSEVCLVLNGQATMLIESRFETDEWVTRLSVISDQMAHGVRGLKFMTLDHWRLLTEPVQNVLQDLLAALIARSRIDPEDPVDNILEYKA